MAIRLTKELRNRNPLVIEFDALLAASGLSQKEVENRGNIGNGVICHWRHHNNPGLINFEAALNALGCRLQIVPMFDDIGETNETSS